MPRALVLAPRVLALVVLVGLLLVPIALALLAALGLQQGGFRVLAGERQAVQEPAPASDPPATQAGAELRA